MLLKLAARNIRRSVRDYAIYFVTLVFGVAVFYAFNSIGSQQVLFDISQSSAQSIFNTTQTMLNGLSVFIAFVLGFLIVYANRFLIKRRKHEFGIYLTLGMSPRSCRSSCSARRPSSGWCRWPSASSAASSPLKRSRSPRRRCSECAWRDISSCSPRRPLRDHRVLHHHLRRGGAVQPARRQPLQAHRPPVGKLAQRERPRAQPLGLPRRVRRLHRRAGVRLQPPDRQRAGLPRRP